MFINVRFRRERERKREGVSKFEKFVRLVGPFAAGTKLIRLALIKKEKKVSNEGKREEREET